MPARKSPHLLESLHRHQSGQRLPLPLDDEFVMPQGDSVQHVSDALPDVHRRNLVGHRTTPATIIVAFDAIGNQGRFRRLDIRLPIQRSTETMDVYLDTNSVSYFDAYQPEWTA